MVLPPMISGSLPIIGHAFEMMNNREKLFTRGYAEQGDIFTINLGNQNAVVLTNKDYARTFFLETDKTLNISDVYDFIRAAIGEVLFTAGKSTYYNQRPVLTAIFGRERMVDYISAMNAEVQNWLDSLDESGEMDISEEMLRLTQYVAAHAFLGEGHRNELDRAFWDSYRAISESLDPMLPPHLPLPKFRRRDKARKAIRQTFETLVEKRRQQPEQYDDLITILLTTPQKDGTFMNDDEIATMFTGLLFAGHETTAGQAAWTVIQLLEHPDYLSTVLEEISELAPGDVQIDAGVLRSLQRVYWAIDETTRMYPSADLLMRLVEEPIQIGDYMIPEGWRLITSGTIIHQDETVFTDPQHYDPERYSPERNEGSDPFAIMGFGGGIHKCTGMNFAKNEMAVIVTRLLRQFELELVTTDSKVVTGMGANHPSETIVRYKRRII